MNSPILYKTITANTQITTKECYLVGVELTHSAATILIIYNEDDSGVTATKKVATLRVSAEFQDTHKMFPLPGIRCIGLYADWTAGLGTVYYHY